MLSSHAKGLLITAAGVLIITPDGLLTRLIQADPWTLLFWRSLLSSVSLLLVLSILYRRQCWARIRAIGLPGLMVAALFGVGGVTFILAITSTTVANTLFIASTSPLFAALISWRLMGEAVPRRTWIAIVLALLGIAIIASQGLAGGSLFGNLAALTTAIALACSFSLIRYHKERDLIPAMALSTVIAALIALPFATPAAISAGDAGWLAVMGLLMLPLAFALMFIGPRYIPAAEVSLILLLEAILGPFWVWLVVGEEPGARTLVGGAIVIVTLSANAALGLRSSRTSGMVPGPVGTAGR
ncbi:MAG: DMT family transporter [Kiloniellales bacterium]